MFWVTKISAFLPYVRRDHRDGVWTIALLIAAAFAAALPVSAQRLPFRSYSTLEGLSDNYVEMIYQDDKGFIWIATAEGLSRFDGYEFQNYGVKDGLPSQRINDITQDNAGSLWIAANDHGIAYLKPDAARNSPGSEPLFTKVVINGDNAANKVNRIMIDSRNTIWCLTDNGVYTADLSETPTFRLFMAYPRPVTGFASRALFEAANGNIWFAIHDKLFEVSSGGLVRESSLQVKDGGLIIDALESNSGRILALEIRGGLFELDRESGEWRPVFQRSGGIGWFLRIMEDSNDSLWIGCDNGAVRITDGQIQTFTENEGLFSGSGTTIFEDRENGIWLGSALAGVAFINDFSLTSFDLPNNELSIGITNLNGIVNNFFCADLRDTIWNCEPLKRAFDSRTSFGKPEPFPRIYPSDSTFAFTKRGDVWGVQYGRSRASRLMDTTIRIPEGPRVDLKDLLKKPFETNDDLTVYSDASDKSLWVGQSDGTLLRISAGIRGDVETEEFTWELPQRPHLIAKYASGSLWITSRGIRGGRLVHGKYTSLANAESVPTDVSISYVDSRGRIWLGTFESGVYLCAEPDREVPVCRPYTISEGLMSNTVWSISEDNDGRIYLGTGKGMVRFDEELNNWNSLIAGRWVSQVFRDSSGNMWANTGRGPIRFDPAASRKPSAAPPVYITDISLAGEHVPVPESGTISMDLGSLSSSQNNITIDFVGLQYSENDPIRYRYMLEGSEEDWSAPNRNRSITFGNLSSGDYRFAVKAVNGSGIESEVPAYLHFRIYPPIYLRWWFLGFAALAMGSVLYMFYSLRLKRVLEVARIRSTIAKDLHDDIGSDLSKISVLGEVARMRLGGSDAEADALLLSIAEISREAVGSMRDIVWATDPARDSMEDLARKMREHAEELFVPRNVAVHFSQPKNIDAKLPMALRRELYLVFKEAIINAAKHSGCTKIRIELSGSRNGIDLSITDDGRGFDTSQEYSGSGLRNLSERAAAFKGNVEIVSAPNVGTSVSVNFPNPR